MADKLTPLMALRILERQITKARESVGVLDMRRAINSDEVNPAIDALWEYVMRGGVVD